MKKHDIQRQQTASKLWFVFFFWLEPGADRDTELVRWRVVSCVLDDNKGP